MALYKGIDINLSKLTFYIAKLSVFIGTQQFFKIDTFVQY